MKLYVTFKRQNPDYNKDYAEEYHGGKESENNWKDDWSIGFKLDDIDKIAIIKGGEISLRGKCRNEEKIDFLVPNMTILECYTENHDVYKYAISKALLKNTHKVFNEKYDTMRFYFYLKPESDYFKIGDNCYVLKDDIPVELTNSMHF